MKLIPINGYVVVEVDLAIGEIMHTAKVIEVPDDVATSLDGITRDPIVEVGDMVLIPSRAEFIDIGDGDNLHLVHESEIAALVVDD